MVASTKRKAGAGAQPAFQDTNGIGTLPQTAPTPQAPRPWREVFKVHPAAEMFPLMSADELRELADDIKKNGLLEPVSYVEDGDASFVVIDGRNRLDALALLGIHVGLEEVRSCGESRIRPEIRYCEAATKRSFMLGESPEISDLTAWIVAKNIRRRHLNAEQKRDIIAKLLKATPEKSNRAIAKTVNVDHKTVAAVRNEAEGRGEFPHVDTRTDTKGRAQPATKSKIIKAATAKVDRPPQVINATITKAEPKPLDVLAEFKTFVRRHLDPLPINERTEMARRWVAHINTAYLPARGEPIVDAAKRVVQ